MSKEIKEVKEVKQLKPEIAALSEKIQTGVEFNKTEGKIVETKNNYEENLPEDLTMENVKKVSKYNEQFIAASTHAVGTVAVQAFKENKKLERVESELKVGDRDHVRHAVLRTKTIPPIGGEGEPTVKHGYIKTEVDTRGTHTGTGQLKVARDLIGHHAMEVLKK